MPKRALVVVSLSAMLVVVTGCWPMPNRIAVGPDGLLALSMPDETSGSYEALPQRGHIWLLDTVTGRVQTVIAEGENLSWATFSPNGQELLYVESPPIDPHQILTGKLSHPWKLMLLDRRSGTLTELVSADHGFLWAPTFSPDGRKIAYYRGDGEDRLGLYIFDRDGGGERLLKLMQDAHGLYYAPYGPGPLWTPDGQWLFVFGIEEIFPERTLPSQLTPQTARIFAGYLAMASVECTCEQRVLRGFFPLLPVPLSLIASPDGQKLYVNGYDRTFSVEASERVNLYEVTRETGEQATLYDKGGIALAPALSPEGEQLLFTVIVPAETPKADLYLLNLLGMAPARPLTDDGRSGFGFWLSDQAIGFVRLRESEALGGEIWTRDLSTHEERNLSVLLGVQSSLVRLSRETKVYKEKLAAAEQALGQLEQQIRALHDAVTVFSQKLDAVQTQGFEMGNRTEQRLAELSQQIALLLADMSAVKGQISGVETALQAANARPALSVWELVLALLIAVIVIVWLIRRALQSLAQQLAFPPQ